MQAYQITHGSQIDGLTLTTRSAASELQPNEVKVRIRAAALNYRDLMVAMGTYPTDRTDPVVPGSDFAGDVVAAGAAVKGLEEGDRVMGAFLPDWQDGAPTPEKLARSFGVDLDGALQEEIVVRESDLVRIPENLSYVEASTLPCSGVTAWNALFEVGNLQPGSTVLLLGTGGVSIMALQMAKAAGHRVIITSSSNEKLAKAREMGADSTINYREQPEWQDAVLEATHGKGVDLVLEVGGKDTVERSISALGMGGTVALIGGVSGFSGSVDPVSLLFACKKIEGVYVGSKAMLQALGNYLEINGIRPVVDSEFRFDQVPEAYRYLEAGKHFGKVVVRFD